METTKINNQTIEFTKVIPEEVIPARQEVVQYDYEFLVKQKENIEQDLENLATRQAKEVETLEASLTEVEFLLSECAKLGVDGKQEVLVDEII